jgi:uncharacterized protein
VLPLSLLSCATLSAGNELVPSYFGDRDHPLLRALIEEHARYVGEKLSAFSARLSEPLTVPAPKKKLRLAAHTLERLSREQRKFPVAPRAARAATFRARASDPAPRQELVESVAASFDVTPADLERSLFADLRHERRIAPFPEPLTPHLFAATINDDLVKSLIARAAKVEIVAWGNTRALVRHAQRLGLICNVEERGDTLVLDISGPYALFRHTALYGRALASLVPRAAWCERFTLRAECVLGRSLELHTVRVQTGDPLRPARELERYDSRLESRFALDFLRLTKDWDLVREPGPFRAGKHLVFPDFEIVHRRNPERRFTLEVVGFWTREYLEQKLQRLAKAEIKNLILAVDQARAPEQDALPAGARVIAFRKKIDPRAVLALIEG